MNPLALERVGGGVIQLPFVDDVVFREKRSLTVQRIAEPVDDPA
jgi:hypothetical protein